jgi:hypothetical protein
MRAADLGYAPRFLAVFLALGFSAPKPSLSPPQAANAKPLGASYEYHIHILEYTVYDLVKVQRGAAMKGIIYEHAYAFAGCSCQH